MSHGFCNSLMSSLLALQTPLRDHFVCFQVEDAAGLHCTARPQPPPRLCVTGVPGLVHMHGGPAVRAAESFRPHQPCLRAGCSLAHYTEVAEWSCTFNTAAGRQNRA